MRSCFIFGLPGNPVSCLVCKTLLVNPLITALRNGAASSSISSKGPVLGRETDYPSEVLVKLQDLSLRQDPERPEYHRCIVVYQIDTSAGAGGTTEGELVAYSTGSQKSSRVLSLQSANALLKIPAGEGVLTRGHKCSAILLSLPASVYIDAAAAANAPMPATPHESGCSCCRNSNMQSYYKQVLPNNGKSTGVNSSLPTTAAPNMPMPAQASSAVPQPHTGNAPKTSKLPVRVGILTVSDRASAGVYPDKAGPMIAELLREMASGPMFYPLEFSVDDTAVVPDDIGGFLRCWLVVWCCACQLCVLRSVVDIIQEKITLWCDNRSSGGSAVDVLFTTGGTGFGLKDYTPEAVRPLLTREAPGIAQALLAEGLKHTPLAVLSRPVVGVRNQTLIITLPGSTKAIKENIVALKDLLPRILELLILNQCT